MRHSISSSVVVASLLVPLMTGAAGLSVMIEGQLTVFSDVPEDAWFTTYVRQAAEAGIVGGYKDLQGNLTGKFGPGDPVTIAQALKIAVEGAGYQVDPVSVFNCSGPCHWATGYVQLAHDRNFSFFSTDGEYWVEIDRPATRAEVAQVFADAFKMAGGRANSETEISVGNRYDDVTAYTNFAFAIEALSRDGILSGDTDAEGYATGQFRPLDSINRAETVKMVTRAREVYGQPGSEVDVQGTSKTSSNIIVYTDEGFFPSELHVRKGTKIHFVNESSLSMWVASDPHPDHTILEYLDAGRGYVESETYEFDFLQTGSWGFHNHMNSQHRGTIIVE